MILLRSVQEKDFADLYELAAILDSVNLPHDRQILLKHIRHAVASFRGREADKAKALYLFVAEDLRTGRVIGTSSIFARHGAERAPHSFFELRRETRRSRTQAIGIRHRTLQLDWTNDGPTEVGGLVVLPRYRRRPEKIGKQLSLIRFLYMAMHPGRFKKRVLCEFLPNFARDGKSLLWEHLGKKFTGLEYHAADRLSATNKEFILGLFPMSKIYATLMPESVQAILEKTGDASMPAQIMLERMGFRYLRQICPFDGGPHFGARLRDIKIVKQAKACVIGKAVQGPVRGARSGLVLLQRRGTVRGLQAEFLQRGGEIRMSEEAARALQAQKGDGVMVWSYGR